ARNVGANPTGCTKISGAKCNSFARLAVAQSERVQLPPLPPRAQGKTASLLRAIRLGISGATEGKPALHSAFPEARRRVAGARPVFARVGQQQTASVTWKRQRCDPSRGHSFDRLRTSPSTGSGQAR